MRFIGRDDVLPEITEAFAKYAGRVAAIALTGMPGLGKSTVAAAYADQNSMNYKATWWIRAESELSMAADLAALGTRLGWVRPDEVQKEDVDVSAVGTRLEHDGEEILLIYDNALSPDSLKAFLPTGGAAHVLITSNALAWRHLAEHVELRLWPKELGADFLLAHIGPEGNRADAEALSEAFEGLPLALALTAAFCERTGMSLAEFRRRYK